MLATYVSLNMFSPRASRSISLKVVVVVVVDLLVVVVVVVTFCKNSKFQYYSTVDIEGAYSATLYIQYNQYLVLIKVFVCIIKNLFRA